MDKSARGNASQFFIAGELCRRGHSAVVTMGNTPNTDILCSNLDGTRFVHIQVKTFVPGNRTCSVGIKAERDFGDRFFWILGGIPIAGTKVPFEYFIIPSGDMARNTSAAYSAWICALGKKGQAHNPTTVRTVELPPFKSICGWDVTQYRERWDLIDDKLRA